MLEDCQAAAGCLDSITAELGSARSEPTAEPVMCDAELAVTLAVNMLPGALRYRARMVRRISILLQVKIAEGDFVRVLLNLFINAAHAVSPDTPESNEIQVSATAEPG